MRSFRFTDKELRDVSSQIRAYCLKHYTKKYYLLKSIPDIGGIVTSGILCESGDLSRFSSVKHLAVNVGLAPGIHVSGDAQKSTDITMRAYGLIRSYFIEASLQALQTDPIM